MMTCIPAKAAFISKLKKMDGKRRVIPIIRKAIGSADRLQRALSALKRSIMLLSGYRKEG